MSSYTPTLLVSNVLPQRPGDAKYDQLSMRLWDRIIEAASGWRVAREYGQLDGPEGVLLRAERADAIVIMGGEDLHPVTYGAQRGYTGETRHWYRADQAHLALARYALRTGTPLLGICRGMQTINVALGGTLVQHVDAHGRDGILDDHIFARHAVALTEGSQLAQLHDGATALEISSAHHQAVDRLGNDLTVTARAGDGTVEAIEHAWAPLLGVQWHPEDPAADLDHLQRLLGYLAARVAPRTTVGTTLVA